MLGVAAAGVSPEGTNILIDEPVVKLNTNASSAVAFKSVLVKLLVPRPQVELVEPINETSDQLAPLIKLTTIVAPDFMSP
jgi:hypothetical protein